MLDFTCFTTLALLDPPESGAHFLSLLECLGTFLVPGPVMHMGYCICLSEHVTCVIAYLVPGFSTGQ